MKKHILLILSLTVILGISSCKDERPTLGAAPTEADATFTFAPSADNANIIDFTATNSGFVYKWDFGNALLGEGETSQSNYPNAGTYTVTLRVLGSGGSATSSQEVTITEDDLSLLSNPLYTLLTGGIAGGGSKTWVIDSTRDAHMGVGPTTSTYGEWWEAEALIKTGTGLYNDRYTFNLEGFKFDHVTNGTIYMNDLHAGDFPGSYENKTDYSAPYGDQLGESWTLEEGDDTTLTISGNAFLGFYSGVRTYKIINIEENQLLLRYGDTKEDLVWYIRLVPEDFPVDGGGGGGGGGGPVNGSTVTLPIDFETGDLTEWEAFGNSTLSIIDNPQSGGINTSSKVLETVHGNETWAGFFVNLKENLDFTSGSANITLKVFAPVAGDFRIKLENFSKTTEFIEKDVTVNTANTWEEISIDFSEAEVGKYDRLVLFPGWNVADAGTFLIDDIKQN